MRLVILESPYAGDIERNVAYARACLRDSLLRGEAPIASHLLYTQPGVLRDEIPEERAIGIAAGLAWLRVAGATVVYQDLGITEGMKHGIRTALEAGLPVEYRNVPRWMRPGEIQEIRQIWWNQARLGCQMPPERDVILIKGGG